MSELTTEKMPRIVTRTVRPPRRVEVMDFWEQPDFCPCCDHTLSRIGEATKSGVHFGAFLLCHASQNWLKGLREALDSGSRMTGENEDRCE